MKSMNLLASAAFGIGILLGCSSIVGAAQVVVSNLQAPGDSSTIIRNSSGDPLANGCLARVLRFPGKSPAEIAALASAGLESLVAEAQAFGEPSSIGAQTAEPGRLEFQSGLPLVQAQDGLHLLVLNSPDIATATEFLLLHLPLLLPPDEWAGPDACQSVHLADAEVVFGAEGTTGFMTAAAGIVSPFDAWVAAQLGEGASASDMLADADPDRDGRTNLLEYAMGTPPGDGAFRESLTLRQAGDGTIFVRYLRRNDDPAVVCRAEFQANLGGEENWTALQSPVLSPSQMPYPAPAGCEWVEQALPAGQRGFARLKAVAPE